jgi:amino acid adenylation domain-containing protein/non-ribosomal peptide synthase protein (TIGR01720 family)
MTSRNSRARDRVEHIYPLSPLQQGMVFHSLLESTEDSYVEQIVCRLDGPLDVSVFRRAWTRVVARHAILRTSIHWTDQAQARQVVHREVELPWTEHDWSGLAAAEQATRLKALGHEDWIAGFDLIRAPLFRLTLVRIAADVHHLVWSNHHTILDGWSRAAVFREAMALYRADRMGAAADLPAAPQYGDYIAWLQRQDRAKAEKFWHGTLAGFTAPTPLPVGFGPTAEPGDPSGTASLHLSTATTEALRDFSRRHGITLGTLVQAAWGVLLARHGGVWDVVFGVTVAGRPPGLPDVEHMVGLFINTVPVRVQLDPRESALQWLRRLQASLVELREHEHMPLVDIQGWSDVPRGTSLFDSLVVFENYPLGEDEPGPSVGEVRAREQTHYPLTLVAVPAARLGLRLLYATDRGDAGFARGLLGQLEVVLGALAADPEAPVGGLPLLSAVGERERISAWNPDPVVAGGDVVPLVHRFLGQMRSRPDAVALVFGESQFTYRAIAARAQGLAARLRRQGVGAEVLVGLMLQRGPDQVVGVLGIHLAGGAYLPLDPDYPPDRLDYLICDSGARLVVTSPDLADRLPTRAEVSLVFVADTGGTPGVVSRVDSGQLAYVIYTSGSTGRPKGVLVPHAQAARLFDATRGWFGFGARDVWTLFHSIAFDFSVWELWGALAHGGRLVLVPDPVRRTPTDLATLLAEQAVTVLNQTPSAFLPLAEQITTRLPDLRTVIFGGEALPADRLTDWVQRFGLQQPVLVNMYGITETTVHVTHHPLTPTDLHPQPGSLIGHPLPDLRVYLLDEHLRPVPVGMTGEIYVGGAGVTRGYLGKPALTAQHFLPDPHTPDGRLYKTGDLARSLPNGTLIYLGRTDQQIQIRGHRIEPGEIETILRQHPHITDALVLLREDTPGDPRLTAYLTTTTSPITNIRHHIQNRLPAYLHPTHYLILDHLPLTTHGKTDTTALPAPSHHRPNHETPYTAPEGPIETQLAHIWTDILHTHSISRHDNFFTLGGDSILSMQIAGRANRAGLSVSPRQVFEHPTIAELATVIDVLEQPAGEDEATASGPLPLTPIQHWFFARQRPAPHHFNQSVLLRFDEPLDESRLRAALTELVRRHDALRLRFHHEDGEWRQEVTASADHAGELLRVADLSALPPKDRTAALAAAATEAQTSLDLTVGPLIRAVYLRMGEDGDRLLMVVHHLAVDGVSWRILLADLETVYDELSRGLRPATPSGRTSLRVWARRLAELAASAGLAAEVPVWTDMVSGAAADLPADLDGASPGTAGETATITRTLDAAATRALLGTAALPGRVQPVEVLLAALGRTLAAWTGRSRTLIDVEGHGREQLWDDVDLSRTVGWFTSIYPVVVEGGTPRDALRATKVRMRALPHGGLGYQLLCYLRADDVAAPLRAQPDREVLFNYLGRFEDSLTRGDGWRMAPEPTGPAQDPRAPRHHVLEVSAAVSGGRLHVRWTYSPRRHRSGTVERLAESFSANVLELVAAAGDSATLCTPDDFPLPTVDQDTVDRVADLPGGLEDLYPLSPMQQGMLFHLVDAPAGGVNVEQVTCRLAGPLDQAGLRRAWDAVVARHPVLRTSFHWRTGGQPVQAVHREVSVPWCELDWRGRTDGEQRTGLEEFLDADRAARFVPEQAPLMRLTVIRLGDTGYELVWTHHHLLLDGWSLARVIQEVFATYHAGRRGRLLAPAPSRPYREYIAWLGRQDLAKAEAFWRDTFADMSAPTPLPAEPGPAPSGGFATEVLKLPADVTDALTRFARRRQLTLATLVHAAWALFLHRHCDDPDVVFGTVVAGRPADLPGVEAMVGQFINTLPIRVRVEPGLPALDWLREVQSLLAEARQYEYTPLVEIHGCSGVPRDQRLFDSVVVFENYLVEELPETASTDTGELVIERLHGREQTNYPLTLLAAPGDRLCLKLLYDGARYRPRTVRRYTEQLRTILLAMAGTPHRPVAELRTLPDAERRSVLVEWNRTETAFPLDRTLPELLAEQVARTPRAVALSDGKRDLTYAELDAEANRLARHLAGLGVGPEVRVALCLERSPELIVAILAVFQAGGAYVPIDPAQPAERVAFMLADAGVRVLVTTEASRSRLPATAAEVVSLDGDRERIMAHPDHRPPVLTGPGHLAYVIYTSGSTGVPKGAMVEQRGMVNHLLAKVHDLGLAPGDTVAATASPCFDISVWQFFSALLVGARVRVFRDDVTHDAARLLAETERHGATVLEVVPSMLRALLGEPARPELAALRWLLLTGEALPADLCRTWLRRYPSVPVVNAYGPTECSDDVTHHAVYTAPGERAEGVPIGRAIANTRLYVLDARQRPVPIGAPGELCVGGAGVGRGYLGRPDRTAAAFVPDPFGSWPGGRLYRTGDLVRTRADGTLEFLGRIDHQIKLRGFRVELGEIEAVLRRHPAVDDGVVVLREDDPGHQRLAAYIVPCPGFAAPEPPTLRGHCAEHLPEYLVPAAFVLLEEWPLTANGKLDRRALPAVEFGDPHVASHEPPHPGTEERLAAVWADVLGTTAIGRHADFFALGGHSLLAMQVIARLPGAVRAELPLRALFEAPTLAAFARRVEQARHDDPAGPALVPVCRERGLPLSFAQQRLWFLDRWAPESVAYNLSLAVRLDGDLHVAALAAALHTVVCRHEALRTTFTDDGGEPRQVVAPEPAVPLPVLDLGALPSDGRLGTARRLSEQASGRPFDLKHGPLLRTTLLRLAPDDHVLLLSMHHIVGDGWSMGVLLREVTECYRAARGARSARLPDLPVQYPDFAVWQREWLSGERLDGEIAYWRDQLAGAPTLLELPTDRPRPAVQTYRGANHAFTLPPRTYAAVRQLSGQEGATVFMTLLAAFAAVLGRHSGQEDVLVGAPIANRARPELEGLIGFFANTLVLRADLTGEPTFRQLLARLRETTLDAYAHQDLPFERLVEALAPERSTSHSPLVQVLFVLQNAPVAALDWPGVRLRALDDDPVGDTARFDLTLSMRESVDGLHANVEYNTDLFDPDTVARLVAHFRTFLEGALAEPDRPVRDLPLLGNTERDRLLVDWNRTAAQLPDATLPELLALQAHRIPDAVAVTYTDRQLSYAVLWAKAIRLARRLRECGVGPETRVAVCLQRSPELVVALAGVLLAGGAYVPLDPEYPVERLRFMLADTGAPVLLTQRTVHMRLFTGDPRTEARVVFVADDRNVVTGAAPDTPLPAVAPDNLAYVIYTSGSTGTPKGAMNSHRAIVNRLMWMQDTYRLSGHDRVLQKTPFGFDVSVWEFFWPLTTGAGLVLARPDGHRDTAYLVDLIDRAGVTTLHFVPSMLSVFLADGDLPRCSGLRRVLSSGEALPAELRDEFLTRLPGTQLHNLYGPTEAAVDVTFWSCGPNDRTASVPIGRPVANTQVYVLDAGMRPVPVGVPGELFLGGVQVGRGYLDRPALTADRFPPDPFGPAGARLYRTGDRVRWRADGSLEFLGRLDHQVKIRGMRAEPGEADAVLARHPEVRSVVTVPREDVPGDVRLVSYVVAADADAIGLPDRLRSHAAAHLPGYLVPASFVVLPALPLTLNGKLDRRALPVPDVDDDGFRGSRPEFRPPATATEIGLATLWQQMLGVPQVGLDDDFFALGGHSLLATRVHTRLRTTFNVDLPLRRLFELPTVASLAREVDAMAGTAPPPAAAPITPIARDGYRRPAAALGRRAR